MTMARAQAWVQREFADASTLKKELVDLAHITNNVNRTEAESIIDELLTPKEHMFTPGRFTTSIVPRTAPRASESLGGRERVGQDGRQQGSSSVITHSRQQ
jgi:hypothetical protein